MVEEGIGPRHALEFRHDHATGVSHAVPVCGRELSLPLLFPQTLGVNLAAGIRSRYATWGGMQHRGCTAEPLAMAQVPDDSLW